MTTYIPGQGRGNSDYGLPDESHLYAQTDRGLLPMCDRGWNRDYGTALSIWRGWTTSNHCPVCEERAKQDLPPVRAATDAEVWGIHPLKAAIVSSAVGARDVIAMAFSRLKLVGIANALYSLSIEPPLPAYTPLKPGLPLIPDWWVAEEDEESE